MTVDISTSRTDADPLTVLLRGCLRGTAAGAVCGGLLGTFIMPIFGTVVGMGVGAAVGAAMGLVCGLSLAGLAHLLHGEAVVALVGAAVAAFWSAVAVAIGFDSPTALYYVAAVSVCTVIGMIVAPGCVRAGELDAMRAAGRDG